MIFRLFPAIASVCLCIGTAYGATYYAAPNGTGNGLDANHPMTIASFWSVAQPGDTLILLDGLYQGDANMILPPNTVHGLSGLPITIQSQNDGGATLDGQNARRPVMLYNNSYLNLIGFNACNSNDDVVLVERSNYVQVKRVCGWDARDGDTFIFWARDSHSVLFEDCAGWGIARKIFVNTYYGDNVTFRRCWASWDGSHHRGPKMAFSSYYDSTNCRIENCVARWTASRMQQTYYLLDENQPDGYARDIVTGERILYTNYQIENPVTLFGYDRFAYRPAVPAHVVVQNCIAYLENRPLFQYAATTPTSLFHGMPVSGTADNYTIINCLAWQGVYGGTNVAFYLDNATATNVECRINNNTVKNGATITFAEVDVSSILPLPIAGRVLALTGHDMTKAVPLTRNNTYYCSTTGTGDGKTPDNPMSMAYLNQMFQAGDTVIFQDGLYTGSNLFQPTRGVCGKAGKPITFRAEHDGQAVFDGQGTKVPVKLVENQYCILEGLRARNSSANVLDVDTCHNLTLRRITGSDAGSASRGVFYVVNSNNVIIENCAGWGSGDYIFLLSNYCDNVNLTYCFGRWTRGFTDQGKSVFGAYPSTTRVTFDKCVGLWQPDAVTTNPTGVFEVTRVAGSSIVNCVGRNRGLVQNPRGLYVLTGVSLSDRVSVANCLAYGETPGVLGAIFNYCSGGPFDVRGATTTSQNSSVTPGTFNSAAIGSWPMQSRILSEAGIDVESLYIPPSNTTWYVSASGTGSGTSQADPMSLSAWLGIAKPGDTVNLLDGTYTGDGNMLVVPSNVSGTSSSPITVRALNEGAVTINGEDVRQPIKLTYNSYWNIEGINACRSNTHVVELDHSPNCNIRKVCAWTAGNSTTQVKYVFYSHDSANVLFEDSAGWGRGTQIFTVAGASAANNLYRRCWASWETTAYPSGQKIGFCVSYSSAGTAYASAEDCIGRWAADASYSDARGVFSMSSGTVPNTVSLNRCIAYTQQTTYLPWALFRLEGDHTTRMPLYNCRAKSIPYNPTGCAGFTLTYCYGGPIEAINCKVNVDGTNSVTQGLASIPVPFTFPINSRILALTGHDVLGTLGLGPAVVINSVVVQTGTTVDVTFSRAMGTGSQTPANYALSGTGKGTLATNPSSVTPIGGNTYRLTWTSGEMVQGGNITITASGMSDSFGYPLGSPISGTHTGGGMGTRPSISAESPARGSVVTSLPSVSVTFSEAVTGVVATGLTVNGSPATGISGSGAGPYVFTGFAAPTASPVSIALAAGSIRDAAGNPFAGDNWTYALDGEWMIVSGTIRTSDHGPVFGVQVTADNGGGTASTNAQGYYELTVPYGWSGTVTPAKVVWSFTPVARSYTGVISDLTDNFTAIPVYLPGDAGGDGWVTFEDFAVLQNNYGGTGKSWFQGDFSGDGRVGFEDFSILQNHYGQSADNISTPIGIAAERISANNDGSDGRAACLPVGLIIVMVIGGTLCSRVCWSRPWGRRA